MDSSVYSTLSSHILRDEYKRKVRRPSHSPRTNVLRVGSRESANLLCNLKVNLEHLLVTGPQLYLLRHYANVYGARKTSFDLLRYESFETGMVNTKNLGPRNPRDVSWPQPLAELM